MRNLSKIFLIIIFVVHLTMALFKKKLFPLIQRKLQNELYNNMCNKQSLCMLKTTNVNVK